MYLGDPVLGKQRPKPGVLPPEAFYFAVHVSRYKMLGRVATGLPSTNVRCGPVLSVMEKIPRNVQQSPPG